MHHPASSAADLRARWPLPATEALRDELIEAYAHPERGYHDTTHLSEVLDRLDELAEQGTDYPRLAVVLAAWFHDGIYDGERDAEERSAHWAESALVGHVEPAVVAEVARLVRLTETHTPDDGDAAGCALSDADLAILAAPRDRYDEYVATVRQEFAHLDDEVFRAGRAAVLGSLGEKTTLFHTRWAREQWEAAARANLERELDGLLAVDAQQVG
ncbi:unannotated protein [freshwater metagenome]|uniref:Unannotated protein n=1 Tax=freshwater metagenome TaxID=449393 RepID=A0A6J6Q4X2_9ZZZZ